MTDWPCTCGLCWSCKYQKSVARILDGMPPEDEKIEPGEYCPKCDGDLYFVRTALMCKDCGMLVGGF